MAIDAMKTFFQKNKTWLVLGAILLVAAFVRFYHIEAKMRFIWDEGRDMLAIRKIIVQQDLTLFGPYNEMGSKKDFFGVFHYYLMLLALWLADYNPIGPAIFTALLGVVSVGLVYQLISIWSDKKLALWTAAIYAISPLAVKYSIWPWNPNTMPFFGLLYLLFISKYFKKSVMIWVGLAGFTLGLLFQLHYFSIALIVPWLMIAWKKKSSILSWVLFISAFLLANLNFIFFDLTHDWFYLKILKDSFVGGSSQQLLNFSLAHMLTAPFIFTNDTFSKLSTSPGIYSWPVTVIFLIYSLRKINRFLRGNKIELETMIVGTWLGLLAIISLFPTLANDYYANYLWFGLIMIMLKAFITLSSRLKLNYFFVFLGILFSVRLLIKIDLNRQPTWQENMPLIRQLSKIVSDDAQIQSKTFNIASLAESDTRAIRYRYFLDVAGSESLGVDDYSRTEVLYVISPHDIATSQQNPAWEISTFIDQQWQLLGSIDKINVFKVEKK